jgi:DNA-binding MarR family transcriptional regulator
VGIETPVDRARLAARLRLAVTRLNRRLRQEGSAGLTPTAGAALATVLRRGPLSLSELAALEGVRPPTISATVAALEAEGLLRREADPADRRVTRVAITAKGRHQLDRSRTRKTAYLADRLGRLEPARLELLEEAAAILESLLEDEGQ